MEITEKQQKELLEIKEKINNFVKSFEINQAKKIDKALKEIRAESLSKEHRTPTREHRKV